MSLSPQFGSIVPSPTQTPSPSAYLAFNGGANDFAQQYLPEIYEQEVERYGNRTLSGFLRMVGAEMPMTSDQVIWSEQNRLHISYNGCTVAAGGGAGAGLASVVTIPIAGTTVVNVISINDTVVLLDPATGAEGKGIVTARAAGNVTVQPFANATFNAQGITTGTATIKMFVYGSDYTKGTTIGTGVGNSAARVSVDPNFTQFSNSPVIIRDQYVVTGSDMAQIGWVEVATEDGASGYLWYLKAESETRLRFEDYLEMAMVEGELNANVNGAAGAYSNDMLPGTQGLFAAIRARGNVEVGFTAAAGLDEFDAILKNLDTQGAIEENMLFLQRQTSLDFDDMLASISGGFAGGTAFGLFENSEEMALNLGFSGFRRGSYDFYKTDWKYLNDWSTRGGFGDVEGVLIPAGTSTVYDQQLGQNIKRPFLHIRYRASETENRKNKSWITGSVGTGSPTSDIDEMKLNYLSERCLITQAANNFVLFKA
jgi:hypothetical protein